MTRQEIIAAVNGEIQRLEQVRALLQSSTSDTFASPGEMPSAKSDKPKRELSADARRRIAQAQKRRWAKQRGAAS
jgi:hypothetical protein